MHSYLRVIIFVVSISMEIGSTRAICAEGQSSEMRDAGPCTEPEKMPRGNQHFGSFCNLYANPRFWGGNCVQDNNCHVCPCSCGTSLNTCPPRPLFTEVCTTCPDGHSGDGMTCTLCATGTLSTVPISLVCSECPAMYNASELTEAHANGISEDCIEIYQDP